MRASVKTAAYGLLLNLDREEVAELIEVLQYFNDTCREESRAACLESGCKDTKSLTENKTAGSTNIYMQGGQSVCPCCKR